jgi:hypothetical protein
MYIPPTFEIIHYIDPKLTLPYKLQFVDKNNLDNLDFFRTLSNAERIGLKPYIAEIGGHWNEVSKSFVFMNEITTMKIIEAIEKFNKNIKPNDEYLTKEKWQAYFTPSELAKRMHELAKINEMDIVLDPSAGTGNLVDDLTIPKGNIFLIEPNKEFCQELRKKGYINIIEATFEEAIEKNLLPKNITKIIMNPPFSKQTDLIHIAMAYDIISPNGIVISITGKNSLFEKEPNGNISIFLNNFNRVCNDAEKIEIVPLPEGSFKESGTICDTCLVFLEKGNQKNKEKRQSLNSYISN